MPHMTERTQPLDPMVRCVCGRVLAERLGDLFIVKIHGRRMIVRDVVSIVCERCQEAWHPPK